MIVKRPAEAGLSYSSLQAQAMTSTQANLLSGSPLNQASMPSTIWV